MGGVLFFFSFFFPFLSRCHFFFSILFFVRSIEIQMTIFEGENLGTFYCLAELFCKHDRPSRCFSPTFRRVEAKGESSSFRSLFLGPLFYTIIHHQPSDFSPRKRV